MFKKLFVLLIFAFLIFVGGFVWWSGAIKAPSRDETEKRVVITRGSSASQIGNELKQGGIVKNSFAFKFYVHATGASKDIQAGEYNLSSNLKLREVVDRLLDGPSEIWVTIPEGLRREQVAEKFVSTFGLLEAAGSTFRSDFLAKTQNSEGYLFPDTYLLPKDASAAAVANLMTATFGKRVTSEMRDDLAQTGLALDEAVTLASLVERETLSNEERPVVAGIILNRLEADWPLQVDAAVQYAVGKPGDWWPRPLASSDLAVNSFYNTYEFTGLPPGPIASPGLSSIKAAIYPENSDYWFYLHDSDGEIHYAETLEEHNLNIARYLGK